MKTIDKNRVLIAAASVIVRDNEVTTLTVKNELRKNGYKAYQSEVSNIMTQLSNEENWVMIDNGTFRTYYPIVSKGSKIISSVLKTKTSGCWEVNSILSSTVVYVNGLVSRDTARRAFIQTIPGTAWINTRSRRVK